MLYYSRNNVSEEKKLIQLQRHIRRYLLNKENSPRNTKGLKENNNNDNIIENNVEYIKNYKKNNCAIYTGEIVNDLPHGKGIQIWSDGAKYEGNWKFGKANGYGIFYHVDGDIYKGYWKDDKANGEGIYESAEGVSYEGNWLDDYQHGKGVETWKDGSKFKGSYVKGKKEGYGEYIWKDGSQYYGNWVNNNQEGYVRIYNNVIYRESINGQTKKHIRVISIKIQ